MQLCKINKMVQTIQIGKISEIVNEDITFKASLLAVIITNAIYFNASWNARI